MPEILYCDCCGREFSVNDLRETNDGYFLCDECVENAAVCCNCGSIIYEDYKLSEFDDCYCEDCWDDLGMEEPVDYMELAHAAREDEMMGY